MVTLDDDRALVLHGDALTELLQLPECSIDSVVTDPPYELGFMGKAWDASGIAFSQELWTRVLRVLKPGGHLLAFGGTRTAHRQTVAIEDAGFEIRDGLTWNYATGFPKSLNLGDGRGTALKPAQEPLCLARKPFSGTVAANVAQWGCGALNIDACRIPVPLGSTGDLRRTGGSKGHGGVYGDSGKYTTEPHPAGRWPANALFDVETIGPLERFFFCAKPSRAERDLGCDELPERSAGEAVGRAEGSEGLNSPRAGAGRTGGARNTHCTVKPLTLMRYLVRLVTPPGGTVLDPFAGSGTSGMAALAEGFNFVGVEKQAEYLPILQARLQYALTQPRESKCAS